MTRRRTPINPLSKSHNRRVRPGKKPSPASAPVARPRLRLPVFLEALFRWGILALLMVLLAGSLSARRSAVETAAQLDAELDNLEKERTELQDELDRFSDPDWRESYWKWRTMRHEPGEYYIDFIEPGTL